MEITTAMFAALPTPVVPLSELYPEYELMIPIANPNNADLVTEDQMSVYEIEAAASLKYNAKLVLLIELTIMNEPSKATISANTTSNGSIKVVAITRVTTK